jgi:hypothetical protein
MYEIYEVNDAKKINKANFSTHFQVLISEWYFIAFVLKVLGLFCLNYFVLLVSFFDQNKKFVIEGASGMPVPI